MPVLLSATSGCVACTFVCERKLPNTVDMVINYWRGGWSSSLFFLLVHPSFAASGITRCVAFPPRADSFCKVLYHVFSDNKRYCSNSHKAERLIEDRQAGEPLWVPSADQVIFSWFLIHNQTKHIHISVICILHLLFPYLRTEKIDLFYIWIWRFCIF